MASKQQDIRSLLERLKRQNETDQYADLFVQKLRQPQIDTRRIGSLSAKVSHELTPQLQERFAFADRWTNAVAGFTWLGIEETTTALQQKGVQAQLARRKKDWPASEYSKSNGAELTLFGIDKEEQEETYLKWGKAVEPQVLHYSGHDEHRFPDLRTFVLWLLGEHEEQA